MEQRNNKGISQENIKLFDLSLISYIIFACYTDAGMYSLFNFHGKYFAYFAIFFSLLTIFNNKQMPSSIMALFVAISTYVLFLFVKYDYIWILPMSFIVFAAYKIPVNHILRVFFYSTVITTLFVCVLCLVGALPDKIFEHPMGDETVVNAHSLGFYYYSGFSFRAIVISIVYLYFNRTELRYYKIILFILFTILVYYISSTRLQLIVSLLMLIITLLSYKYRLIKFKSKIWKYLGMMTYPISYVLFLLISLSAIISPDFYDRIDILTNGRMNQVNMAFLNYQIELFGNKIEMVGNATLENKASDYFYIDTGFVYWILAYGIVFSIIVITAYTFLLYKTYKYNQTFLFFWCFLFCFAIFINDFFTYSQYYPVIILLFADFSQSLSNKHFIKAR